MKSTLLFISLFLSSLLTAQSDANAYDATVPRHYFDFSLKLVKETPGFTPPVAARAFGYMGLSLYESVVPGIPGYKSMDGILYELAGVTLPDAGAEYHWPTVANNALALMLDSLFRTAIPANKDSLQQIKTYYNTLFEAQLTAQVFNDSKAFGEAIATDIFDYSRTDGGYNSHAENFPASYVPPVGPDLWVPFGNQTCLQPYWGSHRPFIEEDTIEAISPDPPEFSTEPGSDFYNYAFEVYDTGLNLTQEEMTIALYWADGGGTFTPAGHSISILNQVIETENTNLADASIAYAKLGIALSDAFLACWKTKYIYNLCRPVTYVRQYIDSTWLPFIATPPFPEYPSGHSSQSGAMATVMTDVFGSSYTFTDHSHGDQFGGPRTFDSFDEAALEAATSRLYGGIHFGFGNQAGLNLGTIVGENVNDLFEQLNVATDHPEDALASIDLYPNPAQDVVHLKTNADMTGNSYQMLDAYGKVVSTGTLKNDITSVDVSSLNPGMYLIRFDNDEKSALKIIKQ